MGQKRAKGGPGPPKRVPKEPPKALKNRSAQKYRKIRCFILEKHGFARFGYIFENLFGQTCVFLLPSRENTVFYEAGGGPQGEQLEKHIFAGRAAVRDVSRFLGGRGLAKSRKIAFSRGRCCKNCEKNNCSRFWAPPGPKSTYGDYRDKPRCAGFSAGFRAETGRHGGDL